MCTKKAIVIHVGHDDDTHTVILENLEPRRCSTIDIRGHPPPLATRGCLLMGNVMVMIMIMMMKMD